MENKTLQDFQNEVFKEHGYQDISEAVIKISSLSKAGIVFHIEMMLDKAAERYAYHVAEQACRKHKKILQQVVSLKPLIAFDNSIVTEENMHEAEAISNMFNEIDVILNAPVSN